tara:strand:+ start:1059 stop:1919 length:861 start_codon:yes stop_codon:yes gene_type:complete
MANIIDLPDFMFVNNDRQYNKLSKILLFLKGLLVGFIFKITNGKLFCFFINFIFRKDGKIHYQDNFYFKTLSNNKIIRYPNKRIDRVVINHRKHFKFFLESYCIDQIEINDDDLIVDCGANVGELFYALDLLNYKLKYIGFEPDPNTFRCLSKNLKESGMLSYEVGLSDKTEEKEFYIDTNGADSSLVYFGNKDSVKITTSILDEYNLDKIKLFKVEAEGHELEVLMGAQETLQRIKYISVDYGPEKGINKDTTVAEVTNYLFNKNFEMISGSKYRQIGLFKNKLI